MPFGYMPNRTLWKDVILRILGHPSLIRRVQTPVIMRMLEPQGDEAILDAGCGSGFFTYEIAKRCKISIGLDWSIGSQLSLAADQEPRLAYIRGDIQKLPLVTEKFDKILLSSVLQMVEDDEALLKECHRILKNEGLLILSVPTGYIHFKRLNRSSSQLKKRFGALGKAYHDYEEVARLLRDEGFQVLDAEYSPKKWGSLIYEAGLFLWYRFGFPFSSPILFPLLYSLAYFDRIADGKQIGCEIIIKARKVPNE